MRRMVGRLVLGLSACGYPLSQFAVRRCGVRGAAVAEAACTGLAIRDASMVVRGLPARLRTVPAALLRLELAAACVASLAGLHPLVVRRAADQASSATSGAADALRRAAVAMLFAVHTIRFGIYLSPDQGRRAVPAPDASRDLPGCVRQPQ